MSNTEVRNQSITSVLDETNIIWKEPRKTIFKKSWWKVISSLIRLMKKGQNNIPEILFHVETFTKYAQYIFPGRFVQSVIFL